MTAALRFRRERLVVIRKFLFVFKEKPGPASRYSSGKHLLEPGSVFIVLDRHVEGSDTVRILSSIGIVYAFIEYAVEAAA